MTRFHLRGLRNLRCTPLMVLLSRGLALERRENLEVLETGLRLIVFATKLRDAGTREHSRRIRIAQKIIDLANSVIAEEVRTANSLNKSDPEYMSWQQVADALDISRTAAFTRYGKERK